MRLATERLVLRQWTDADRPAFAEMNADPEVMRYFPAPLTTPQSDEFADHIARHIDDRGWGLWAVQVVDGPSFIGFVGLNPVGFDPFRNAEAVEVGWRLARSAWGHGYASEAARTCLDVAFGDIGLAEVISFTSAINHPSIAVMRRVGMSHDPSRDFDHPRIPEGHPLRPHVVYSIGPRDHRSGAR